MFWQRYNPLAWKRAYYYDVYTQNSKSAQIKQRWPLSELTIPSLTQSNKILIAEQSLEDVEIFIFFKAVLKLFTVFYWECCSFLRVYFRILLGRA